MKKEIPILFKTEMVTAILENRKNQTRRIVPEKIVDAYYEYDDWASSVSFPGSIRTYDKEYFMERCKYHVGDILWVKETFAEWKNGRYVYKADGFIKRDGAWERDTPKKFHDVERVERWKPSIFMPKEAARIFLEVTDIRVERLQDISEQDAIAEGIEKDVMFYKNYLTGSSVGCANPINSYKSLWQKINGIDSWEANPWVWVIEFKKL